MTIDVEQAGAESELGVFGKDQIERTALVKRLVFLVGAPRSGTTWLQLLLSRSPLVATAQETDLFNIFLRPIVTELNRCRSTGERMSLSEVLSDDEFLVLLRGISAFVFGKIAVKKPSACVILEKTPNHVQCWREILELWPDSHFIHIIRDPRSVVASRRAAVRSWGPNWGSSKISTIAQMWASFVSDGLKIAAATKNYQEVSYHELVSDGPKVLMRIFEQLRLPASLDDCRRYVNECSIKNLKECKLDGAPFDMARSGKYRFRIGSIDSWSAELSPWEIAVVERVARPLMAELGFKPVRNKPLSFLTNVAFATKDMARAAKGFSQRFNEWLRGSLSV